MILLKVIQQLNRLYNRNIKGPMIDPCETPFIRDVDYNNLAIRKRNNYNNKF